MQIERSQKFKIEFREVIFYIAKDKNSASKLFKNRLNESINNLVNFPYKNRKSLYFENEQIRDLTFNGYTIIYEIFEDKIEIITIFNQNKPSTKA